MLLFLFLFGLALGAESPSGDHEMKLQRGNCPMFWFGFNHCCYKYVTTRMTWAHVELYCVSERANLVSIHSLKEQEFVKSLIKNFDAAQGKTWIGVNDIPKEGRWMWSDACAVDFVFWDAEEPNNHGEYENCVHNKHDSNVKWIDCTCSDTYPSVCASCIVFP